ncbi:MAG TPA: hypothetical protein DCO86_04265 [Spirochaetaceae bacterium]|nr:hypothetical protein [Spirochaetaceae bacterium]
MNSINRKDFLVYDLETFDIRSKYTWISQFAARRYDSDLKPIDDGTIFYCKLADDHMPSLDACVLTGITPQLTAEKGLNELEFARSIRTVLLNKKESTIIAGYNNTAFDNQVVNHLLFRNLLPPYEPFIDRSLDCFTVTKAMHYLDKDKLKYLQVARDDGTMRDSLKLEHLSHANGLIHTKAHDALSDVEATAGLLALIKESNYGIYSKYVANCRKANPMQFVQAAAKSSMPIMAITKSALADSSYATIAVIIGGNMNSYYAFDLLSHEEQFTENMEKLMQAQEKDKDEYISLMHGFCHTIKVNECPYVDYADKYYAGKVDADEIKERLQDRISKLDSIRKVGYAYSGNYAGKGNYPSAGEQDATDGRAIKTSVAVEETMLDGFINKEAPELMKVAEQGDKDALLDALKTLKSKGYSLRVQTLFSHMIARNYPELFSEKAISRWREYVKARLMEQKSAFIDDYNRLMNSNLSPEKLEIVKEVAKYEKEIFDKFSLRLF